MAQIGLLLNLNGRQMGDRFTDPAIEFAKEKSIQLYEYKDIAEWVEILKQE